ncbi:unnamed protein product, partial [marine sediment metagenome]
FQDTSQKGQLSEGRLRRERITEDTDLTILLLYEGGATPKVSPIQPTSLLSQS